MNNKANARLTFIYPPKNPKNSSSCEVFSGVAGIPVAAQGGEKVAVVDEANQPLANNIVSPGQLIRFGVSMKNSDPGFSSWYGFTHKLAMTSPGNVNLRKIIADPNIGNVENGSPPKRVTLPGPIFNSGDIATFWFGASVPTDVSGNVTFDFRMMQDVDPGMGTPNGLFGETCSITLKVPENRPFLTVAGGDLYSGAAFGSTELGADSCQPTASAETANIQTNGYYSSGPGPVRNNGSSASQYAAFSSGDIGSENYNNVNTFLGNYGFDRPAINAKDALFANLSTPTSSRYGKYYGSMSPTLPCVDVRKDQLANAAFLSNSNPAAIANFLSSGSGVTTVANNVTLPDNPITISADGKDKTLIVDGTLTIKKNITYAGVYADVAAISQAKIIARNIHIEYPAQRIDVDLVAIPRPAPGNAHQDGTIDTCSSYASTAGQWFAGGVNAPTVTSCGSTATDNLVLNGSVAARRVLWKRTHGTLGTKADVASASCYLANYSDDGDVPKVIAGNNGLLAQRYKKCAAELIDTNPQSYLGLFNNSNQNVNIPTSTTELPPVY